MEGFDHGKGVFVTCPEEGRRNETGQDPTTFTWNLNTPIWHAKVPIYRPND